MQIVTLSGAFDERFQHIFPGWAIQRRQGQPGGDGLCNDFKAAQVRRQKNHAATPVNGGLCDMPVFYGGFCENLVLRRAPDKREFNNVLAGFTDCGRQVSRIAGALQIGIQSLPVTG